MDESTRGIGSVVPILGEEELSCHSVLAERLPRRPRSMFHVEQDRPRSCFT